MRRFEMGKILFVCCLALLCAGCRAQTPTASVHETTNGWTESAAPAQTQEPQDAANETPAAQEEPSAPEDHSAALAAYLDVLSANREAILGYDWQKGTAFDEDTYAFYPAGVTTAVALADVWGDGTPELIYLTAEAHDGARILARLHVCTWDGGVRELCGDESLDGQVGGGMNYRLFQTPSDKGLWLYTAYYSEGVDETYIHFSSDGQMSPLFTCTHSAYPEEQTNGEWATKDAWKKNGAECSRMEYEADVPAEAEQAAGLLMRNLQYCEYADDAEIPTDMYRYPADGAAMSCDGAIAYLRAQLGYEQPLLDEAAFFASLPEFSFSSGVGAWSTELVINADGTFTGDFHDSNMGEDGEGYPNGTVYVCRFSGRFGNLRRIDEYTYSMRVVELTVEAMPEEPWIEDGVRYVPGEPYGMEQADEMMIYLPGSWLSVLPPQFISWVSMPRAWGEGDRPILLPCWGLYNVAGEEGFSGGNW